MKAKMSALIILLGLGVLLIPVFSSHSAWQTYQNDQYGFSIQYPPEYQMYAATISPGRFEKEGVVLYFGPADYIEAVKTVSETEGPAGYLVVSADVPVTPSDAEEGCLGGQAVGTVSVGGIETTKCLRPSIYTEESLWISLTRDAQTFFRFSSDKYSGEDKATIDQIISTFRFTR